MAEQTKTGRDAVSRRTVLKSTAAASGFAAPMLNFGAFQLFAKSPKTYSAKAIDLVNSNLVIDMLSVMGSLSEEMGALFSEKPQLKDGFRISPEQLEKLRASGVTVFHPAIGLDTYEEALEFIARTNAYVADYPEDLRRIDTVVDMEKAKAEGKLGFIVGLQNSNHFRDVDDVNRFYTLGQRVSQLTYNARNLIGTGSTDRNDSGLSDFGVAIVERMNELGMAVDVSHCGDTTTLDAFDVSKKPVLITHSNVRALAGGHVRCKSDEAIKKMAAAGSVMGITGVRMFVRDKEPTTIEHLLDHYDYVAKLVGVEHLGVGSDMDPDGYDDIAEPAYSKLKGSYKGSYAFRKKIDTDGFDHPQKVYDLTEGLIRRGYSDADIAGVLGGNFKRVLGEIWKPA